MRDAQDRQKTWAQGCKTPISSEGKSQLEQKYACFFFTSLIWVFWCSSMTPSMADCQIQSEVNYIRYYWLCGTVKYWLLFSDEYFIFDSIWKIEHRSDPKYEEISYSLRPRTAGPSWVQFQLMHDHHMISKISWCIICSLREYSLDRILCNLLDSVTERFQKTLFHGWS